MSILNAVIRAYNVAEERDWDVVYWSIDLHGTVLQSNYSNAEFVFIDDKVVPALQKIRALPETRIILWSSINAEDELKIRKLFEDNGIAVDYVNQNPEIVSTGTGNFDAKFYFSILVDDKAGFTPSMWTSVARQAESSHKKLTASRAQ